MLLREAGELPATWAERAAERHAAGANYDEPLGLMKLSWDLMGINGISWDLMGIHGD
jgi:hypothetical protein